MATQKIPNSAARRLFLGASGLLDDPSRPGGEETLRQTIDQLGFVQLDSINVVERAHDLILWSRQHAHRPADLQALQRAGQIFEHWTHDASLIPTRWYAHWKPRFRLDATRLRARPFWRELLGEDADQVMSQVQARITTEGPLRSSDFEHPEKRGAWWDWKPQKAALDYLWRSGVLAIRERVHFHKVYDLAARVHPEAHASPEPAPAAHLRWACETAAARLQLFTPRELAAFFGAVDVKDARRFCEAAARRGALAQVEIEGADGGAPQEAYALPDWEERLRTLPEPPSGLRLLCPFDPVIRDRARCLRRFGFDYRFEAFVPETQRVHGYYVLPILEGDRFVGRLDPKLHRERGALQIRGVWWERGVRATKKRAHALDEALTRLAAFVGATKIERP